MTRRVLCLLLAAAATAADPPLAQLYETDATRPNAPPRRFVVAEGCPNDIDATKTTRLFVAVPSAAQNGRRRQWARASWCRDARSAGAAVKFFVGAAPETPGRSAPDARGPRGRPALFSRRGVVRR